ncbi:MAG: hypothetical protein M3Y87_02370 [Myxococcota bacterium]|nr:hypothetical protein [Myxococcota bacterium]
MIRCEQCGALFDALLRALPPVRPAALGDEVPTSPRELRGDAEQTWIQLDPDDAVPPDDMATDPRAPAVAPAAPPSFAQPSVTQPSFAQPPPAAPASPFAPPPTQEALARATQSRKWTRAVGDGGPPPGLDTLVLILAGINILSIGLWARSSAPIGGCYLVPLTGSLVVVYFFWQGRNWARFLLMLGSLVEIVVVGLAFALVRRAMTGPELLSGAAKLALDVYFLYFCMRPDVAAFFEKRSGRVGR